MSNTNGFEKLMHLANAYRQAKVFLVACDLDIFSCLSEAPKTAAQLAAKIKAPTEGLELLLNALVALELLKKENDLYHNAEISQTYLCKNRANYRGHIIKHMHQCWYSWDHLAEAVKGGRQAVNFRRNFLVEDEKANRDFIWGMNDVGYDRALEISKKLDLSKTKHMLDLGGGAATYSIAFAKKFKNLKSTALDLPLTLKVACENIKLNNMDERIDTKEGDFFDAEFGSGYDLVWISQILHAYSKSRCINLFKKSYRALEAGGKIIIHDFYINEDKTAPLDSTLFAVHMMVGTEGGGLYSAVELSEWLAQAGFDKIKWDKVTPGTMLIEGCKP